MDVEFARKDVGGVGSDMLVVPCFRGKVPKWVHSQLEEAGVGKDFSGEKGRLYLLPARGRKYKRMLLLGFGREKNVELEDFRLSGARIVKMARGLKLADVSVWVDFYGAIRHSEHDVARAMVEGIMLASLRLAPYKQKKKGEEDGGGKAIRKLTIISNLDVSAEVKEGAILTDAQNYARVVDVEPANFMTPRKLAETARKLAVEYKLKFRVLGRRDLERMGMNGILGVSYGSAREPVMVELKYNDGKKLPHVALVGKGITFDSGGISIKPSKGMDAMKFDKTGAVVVLSVLKAVAEMKLPLRITVLMPATENMPSGSATKPGDVLRMYNGKSVEVLNTDAEGRLILGDALAYASEAKPDLMIDAATLTGAMMVVLGRHGMGMLGTDHGAMKLMYGCGLETGERVWELPLWKEYSEMVKGDYTDLKNMGSESGEASTITAAAFLKEFVGKTPWVHLDMASVEKSEGGVGYFCRGPTGKGVRLLATFLKEWAKNKKS
ncbi:MAG: leucyl aminopeptidase family protein [Candidatus Micrarchaeia archaeon]|jgi:leucyl aminopeptidase